jgi:hypothetical protein
MLQRKGDIEKNSHLCKRGRKGELSRGGSHPKIETEGRVKEKKRQADGRA